MRLAAVLALSGLAGLLGGCGGSSSSPAGGPFVPDGASSSAVVWAAGDGADGGPGAKAVARLIAGGKPDLFLYLGDVYPDGAAESFAQDYAPTFGPLAKLTAPTPGNHDWPEHREGYVPYWTKAHGVAPPPYYSFRAGGWQFISLNSEIATGHGSAQQRWLRTQLQSPGDCRIAFWHRPRFSAGTVHGDNPGVDPLWRALLGHARLVLNGHEHDMQRMSPRRGIVELIDGAGGHSFYGLRRTYRGLTFSSRDEFGAIRMRLRRGSADIAFVNIDGRELDRTSVGCHPGRT